MYQKKSKRRKRAQLTFVYTLMAVSVVSVVAVLALVMLGYRFNRYQGTVEQGGLVQFDSRPTGATVSIDGITLANKTTSKITAMSGAHTITIAKDGYTRWQKDVTVQAGGVLWLNYALLMPVKPTVTTIATLPTVTSSLVSFDRKVMAMVAVPSEPRIYVASLNADTPAVTTIVIDASVYTAPTTAAAQTFSLVALDKEGRNALVKHGYDDKTEYLSVGLRAGSPAGNVSRSLGVDIATADYRMGDSGTLYVLTAAHELRSARLSAGVGSDLSAPLVANVAEFTQDEHADTIAYTTLADAAGVRTIGYWTNGAAKARTLGTSTGVGVYRVLVSKYFGERYITVLDDQKVTIRKGELAPSDADAKNTQKVVAEFAVPAGAGYLRYSPGDNRFLTVQAATAVVGYDLELMQRSSATLSAVSPRGIVWIDGYHWASVGGGAAMYYDFDGTNGQLVGSGAEEQAIGLSENYKYLYYLVSVPGGSKLVRSAMTN